MDVNTRLATLSVYNCFTSSAAQGGGGSFKDRIL